MAGGKKGTRRQGEEKGTRGNRETGKQNKGKDR